MYCMQFQCCAIYRSLCLFVYLLPLSLSSSSYLFLFTSFIYLSFISSFLCFSLPIRKHSGLMVGFKLRYKVIRHWTHFRLLCAFTIAQEAFPPSLWTYSTPQHSKNYFIVQHKHCRFSTITKLPKYQSCTGVLMQKTSPPYLAEMKMLQIHWFTSFSCCSKLSKHAAAFSCSYCVKLN